MKRRVVGIRGPASRRYWSGENDNDAARTSKAGNPDLRASLAAMRRAAELARQTAIQTDTEVVVVRDGKLMRTRPSNCAQANDESHR